MRNTISFLRIIAFAVLGYFFLDLVATTGDQSVFKEQPWLLAFYGVVVLFYVACELSNAAFEDILYKTLKPEARARYDEDHISADAKLSQWINRTYKRLLGRASFEEERDIILDHNYDGIRELDNKLPPWWLYGFYASIIFAVAYMARYHIFGGVDQETEYNIAVAEAKEQVEEYKKTAKDQIDANTVELLTDAGDIQAGETIFTSNCVACHKAGGAGGIGPNLTDDYWLLGGGIKNVFHTISEGGRAGKGMISWKTDLKPSEIAQVASYVLSLHGSNPPDAKEPQGELYTDENAPVEQTEVEMNRDSTEIKVIIEDQPVTGDVVNDSVR